MKTQNIKDSTQYDTEQEPIVLSKPLMDLLLEQKKDSALLIGLYTFYYYTAKWQKINQPKVTNKFTSKTLNISPQRLPILKRKLVSLGLIEQLQKRNKINKKITGWCIKINYIFE